jgi:hypothetical protein
MIGLDLDDLAVDGCITRAILGASRSHTLANVPNGWGRLTRDGTQRPRYAAWRSPEGSSVTARFDDLYAGPRRRYGLPVRHGVHSLESPAGAWILYSERLTEDPRFPFA